MLETVRRRAALGVRICAAVTAVTAAVALAGWLLDTPALQSWRPGGATLKPETAVAFLLLAAALVLRTTPRAGADAAAGAASLIGFLALAEHLRAADVLPGDAEYRMAPATAFAMLLSGLSLIGARSRAPRVACAGSIIVSLIGILTLAGHLSNPHSLHAVWPFSSVSIPTAVVLIATSLGVVLTAPEVGCGAILTSRGAAGSLARRFLPAAVVVPLGLGLIERLGRDAGWYETDFGHALMVVAVIVSLSGLLLTSASRVSTEEAARLRAEDEVLRNEQRLVLAQNVSAVGSWELTRPHGQDQTAESIWFSAEFMRILGFDPALTPASPELIMQRVHPDDRARVIEEIRGITESDREREYEHRIVWPDGNVRFVHVRGQRFPAGDGTPERIVGTAQDVTNRRYLEMQLIEARKLESIGRLAGGVAHDFNNLLTVINGYAEIGSRDSKVPGPERDWFREIARAGSRAADLTRQLLTFSRRQVVRVGRVDLNEVVKSAEPTLRQLITEDVQFTLTLSPAACPVTADSIQLHQVLMNLVVNARDAIRYGGTIVVEVRRDEPGDSPRASAVLSVSDNGTGMSEETQQRIFDPFFTTKSPGKGTGLGLATVYGAVQQLGGSISVRSELNRGSTFEIVLPITTEAAEEEPALRPRAAPGTGVILVVEDEADVRRLLEHLLSEAGYSVIAATDPDDALRKSARLQGPIDLVLSDVVMPRMSGPELASRIRQFRPLVGVTFMSAYAEDVIGGRGLDLRGAPLVAKPFSAAALIEGVEKGLALVG